MTTPGGPASLKYTRIAASVDSLVAAASALLKSLKTARGALSVPDKLDEHVSNVVVLVRVIAAQVEAGSLVQQLLAVMGRSTPLLLERPSEAALSEALQMAVELAVGVRALKDRTGEGVVLEGGLVALESEMAALGDCLTSGAHANTNASAAAPPSSSAGHGIYEGLVASLGEM